MAADFDALVAAMDRFDALVAAMELTVHVRTGHVAGTARECLSELDAGTPVAEATKFLRRELARLQEAEDALMAARQARDAAAGAP